MNVQIAPSLAPACPEHFPDTFICGVCLSVPAQLASLPCGHLFCSPCLKQAFEQLKKQCPTCRKRCSSIPKMTSGAYHCLKRTWCNLAVKCEVEGCDWTGKAEQGAAHLATHSQDNNNICPSRTNAGGRSLVARDTDDGTDYFNTSNDGPDEILIGNSGTVEVNGTYEQDGYFQNACLYRRKNDEDGQNPPVHQAYIYWQPRDNKWCIALTPNDAQAPGTVWDQIHYKAYKDLVYPTFPPRSGWKRRSCLGDLPAPSLFYLGENANDYLSTNEDSESEYEEHDHDINIESDEEEDDYASVPVARLRRDVRLHEAIMRLRRGVDDSLVAGDEEDCASDDDDDDASVEVLEVVPPGSKRRRAV